jgi:UDPglucose 6-dehydrogenase
MNPGNSIAILGCWHQGVVAAACLANLGYNVIAADADSDRIRLLAAGQSPIFEPGLDALLQEGIATGTLRFTGDFVSAVRDRPFVFVMFDTPVDDEDRSDLSGVFNAIEAIAPHLANNAVLYVTAQVPVGTCDKLAAIVHRLNPSLEFGLAYSPENLRLGQAIELFRHPALPVIGVDKPSTFDHLTLLLAPLNAKWECTDIRTAEMTKHALNAFLALSVCFANELGNLCDTVGANGQRIAQLLRREPRIGTKAMLFPGLGFSGGTLARDMQTLRSLGDGARLDTPLLDGAWASNCQQNGMVIRKLTALFGSLKDVRVAVLGLTYKPDTSTLRRSAALEVIADLNRLGATVRSHDPKADRSELAEHSGLGFHEDVYKAVEQVQAVVVITGWQEYKALDFGRVKNLMSGSVLLDTNNMLDAEALTSLGFKYLDIGRGRTT